MDYAVTPVQIPIAASAPVSSTGSRAAEGATGDGGVSFEQVLQEEEQNLIDETAQEEEERQESGCSLLNGCPVPPAIVANCTQPVDAGQPAEAAPGFESVEGGLTGSAMAGLLRQEASVEGAAAPGGSELPANTEAGQAAAETPDIQPAAGSESPAGCAAPAQRAEAAATPEAAAETAEAINLQNDAVAVMQSSEESTAASPLAAEADLKQAAEAASPAPEIKTADVAQTVQETGQDQVELPEGASSDNRSGEANVRQTGAEGVQAQPAAAPVREHGETAAAAKTNPSQYPELVNQVRSMIESAVQTAQNTWRIHLHPAELGQISLSIRVTPEGLGVTLLPAQSGTAQLMESQIEALRSALTGSGIQLANLQVGQQSSGQAGDPNSRYANQTEQGEAPWRQNTNAAQQSSAPRPRQYQTTAIDCRI